MGGFLRWVLFSVQLATLVWGSTYSDSFSLNEYNFSCPSVACPAVHSFKQSTIFHIVVGMDHNSAFPLLIHRICEAYMKCIPKENFILILNSMQTLDNSEIDKVLGYLGVKYEEWVGGFTPDKKMMRSFESLNEISSRNTFIYETDLDEVPEPRSFARAIGELESGSCDAVRARWVDRLTEDGSLLPVHLGKMLNEQYPLRCKVSKIFVGAKTEKIVMYRSTLRIDGGHHEVWCSPLQSWAEEPASLPKISYKRGNVSVTSGPEHNECIRHIVHRKKEMFLGRILGALPQVPEKARYCDTIVSLNHYKFIGGLQNYLKIRYENYLAKEMWWWTDSWRFINHIDHNDGRICVECSMAKCSYDGVNRTVEIDHSKKFYCANRHSCKDKFGKTIMDVVNDKKDRNIK